VAAPFGLIQYKPLLGFAPLDNSDWQDTAGKDLVPNWQ
jgi:hypothetical protein